MYCIICKNDSSKRKINKRRSQHIVSMYCRVSTIGGLSIEIGDEACKDNIPVISVNYSYVDLFST